MPCQATRINRNQVVRYSVKKGRNNLKISLSLINPSSSIHSLRSNPCPPHFELLDNPAPLSDGLLPSSPSHPLTSISSINNYITVYSTRHTPHTTRFIRFTRSTMPRSERKVLIIGTGGTIASEPTVNGYAPVSRSTSSSLHFSGYDCTALHYL